MSEIVKKTPEDIKDKLYNTLTDTFDSIDVIKHRLSCIYEGAATDLDILEANYVNHYRESLYEVLELFRNTLCEGFQDWKDADDWLFSRLNLTESDIADIYRGRAIVYTGSCKKEGTTN